jgi:hypothetical protein
MSTPERHGELEQRSSVKISTTAKGDPQVEVKIYDGTSEPDVTKIRELAVDAYKAARQAVATT